MPITILSNKKNSSAVIHANSNGTIVVAGNNSVSNIAYPGEVVNGVSIVQATFGSPSGPGSYWRVSRGANVVAVFDSTAQIDFAGTGMGLNLYPTANVVVELVGGTDGYLMLELQKLNAQSDYLKD